MKSRIKERKLFTTPKQKYNQEKIPKLRRVEIKKFETKKKELINKNKRQNRIFQALKTRDNKWILRPK